MLPARPMLLQDSTQPCRAMQCNLHLQAPLQGEGQQEGCSSTLPTSFQLTTGPQGTQSRAVPILLLQPLVRWGVRVLVQARSLQQHLDQGDRQATPAPQLLLQQPLP